MIRSESLRLLFLTEELRLSSFAHNEKEMTTLCKKALANSTQIIIDKDITDRYETIQLEMTVGQVLFFDGHLAHKSGQNNTKDEVRFSLVGMWNDVSYEGFRSPLPSFKSRTISAKEYFDQKMKNHTNQ